MTSVNVQPPSPQIVSASNNSRLDKCLYKVEVLTMTRCGRLFFFPRVGAGLTNLRRYYNVMDTMDKPAITNDVACVFDHRITLRAREGQSPGKP